jgi:hypothetical protein
MIFLSYFFYFDYPYLLTKNNYALIYIIFPNESSKLKLGLRVCVYKLIFVV